MAIRTFLTAIMKVVEDCGEYRRQIHAVCALCQAKREQLAPTESHQLCLDVLTATNGEYRQHYSVHVASR